MIDKMHCINAPPGSSLSETAHKDLDTPSLLLIIDSPKDFEHVHHMQIEDLFHATDISHTQQISQIDEAIQSTRATNAIYARQITQINEIIQNLVLKGYPSPSSHESSAETLEDNARWVKSDFSDIPTDAEPFNFLSMLPPVPTSYKITLLLFAPPAARFKDELPLH
ncbi:hypothetical protein Hypma_002039 [Hypsizygus marmoreus]|uniref:Uncharacterized protein n=1 Tax=Hypsizygus marmoreus TaxID=39966 RepID=A0A369JDW8_HYPMA|nr:hypothetical protein Hypma_002039 [Hypsizygus marmoreus]